MTDAQWKTLTDGEKIGHLLKTCSDHKYFSRSEPPFDEEFFQILMIDYPLDAIRSALIEMHKYFGVRKEKAATRKQWRKTLSNWLSRKKQREIVTAILKPNFKKKDICHGCRRQYDAAIWGSPKPNRCYDCYVAGI
jgi:hypothetical protein